MITVGSLFSGIGGLDLGLERAGMKVIWQSETDPYASKVLAKHWPDVPNLGDVTTIDWSNVERPDLLCGGFPCQPVSRCGRQRAQADERWLWPAYARAVRQLRPRYVLVENVPGLLVRGMGDVLGDLATLGYDTEWESLPAASVGAPHIRDRVWILAYPEGTGGGSGQRPVGITQPRNGRDPLVNASSGRHGVAEEAVLAGWRSPEPSSWWATEPGLGRVAHGVPDRVDRLRCLGNAVVPQVVEWLAAQIDGQDRPISDAGTMGS